MTIETATTRVHHEPTRVLHALPGLKNIRVLAYHRARAQVELAIVYRVKERLLEFCRWGQGQVRGMLAELVEHCRRPAMPSELRRLGATFEKWFEKI